MRDTPSWAGRHLPGPGWSSGWSHRWLFWSCVGISESSWPHYHFYGFGFSTLVCEGPGSCCVLSGGEILLVGASEGLWPFC